MKLISYLNRLYWDVRDRKVRFEYVNALITNIPGDFGNTIRSAIVPRYFAQAGVGILILPGVRYVGAHNIKLGNHVFLGVDNFLQASAGLEIGDDTMLGPGVKIWTVNHKFDEPDVPIRSQGYDQKPVTIGKNVWIGANSFIMPGVELADGCVVSAGSVVSAKKYPPYSIIAGNPARVMGNRKERKIEPIIAGRTEP